MDFPDSDQDRIDQIATHIEAVLHLLGEDPGREGLLKTPARAAKALWYATGGYRQDPDATVAGAMFANEGSDMVIVRNIEFYSMCEHHILPFFGKVSIGYLPGEKIVGLSKIARVVDIFARRLQVQERFTRQLASHLMDNLGARGVMVHCDAEHMCMKMRGVEKQHSSTATTCAVGAFKDSAALRTEFLAAIGR